MTKEEKQLERREKREAKKKSKSFLTRKGFTSTFFVTTICLFGVIDYLFLDLKYLIFNKPKLLYDYELLIILSLSILLLLIQFKLFKRDFLSNKNGNLKTNPYYVLIFLVYNLMYCTVFYSFLRIPFELYILKNPIHQIVKTKDINAECSLNNSSSRLGKNIEYYFLLNEKIERIRTEYYIKRIEEIEKNNYKQKLRIYLRKGHFDTYILQRYELLD